MVATPIGHLGDITARAVACLRDADRVLAEDTRRARKLLSHLGIAGKRVERLDAQVEQRRLARWIERLRAGERLALVSDAGTPLVADPGARLVRAAVAAGVHVTPLPGPSAVTAALAASGLAGAGFRFVGFLPRSGGSRSRALERVETTEETVVLFESPRRIGLTLRELSSRMPNRPAVVAREMTKFHEQFLRGTLSELANTCSAEQVRGEITLVLGPTRGTASAVPPGDAELAERLAELLGEGLHPKQAAKTVSRETGLPTRQLYDRAVRLRKKG